MTKTHQTTSDLITRILLFATAAWTASIIILAVFHTWQVYNPVPGYDMLEDYVFFYERVSSGDWRGWWMPHNEHCLFFQYPFFWADIRWFHGASIFLNVLNYTLAALLCGMFWFLLSKRIPGERMRASRVFLGLLMIASMFLLFQGENLRWGHQNMFWFVLLLPLYGFYCLQKSPSNRLLKFFFKQVTFEMFWTSLLHAW